MQEVFDDLKKALDCMSAAHKNLELALTHIKGTRSEEEQSKEEIAIRQRMAGILLTATSGSRMAGMIMSQDWQDIKSDFIQVPEGTAVHKA